MSYSTYNLILFLISFVISNLLLKRLINLLKYSFLDIPNNRSSHSNAKPRGGGIIFVIAALISSLIAYFKNDFESIYFIPLISLPLAIIGFLDDKKGLSTKIRFFTQFLTGFSIISFSQFLEFFPNKNTFILIFIIFISILFISGFINFINFMDGLDGLISGCMLILFSTAIIKIGSLIYLIPLVASLIAFLRFNWEPSKIFMGDIGSTFLGSVYVSMIVHSKDFETFLCLSLLPFPLFFDCIICLIRRLLSKQNIFDSHKSHLYQRLQQAGWSHSKVSLTYMLSIIILSFSYLIGGYNYLITSIGLVSIIAIIIEKKYAVPFKKI